MAHELKWLDDSQRALNLTFMGNWGWADVEKSRPKIRSMVATIPHDIYMVVDFNTEIWIPGGIDLNVARFNQNLNPKIKVLVMVISNPLLRNLALIYSKKPGGLGYPVKLVSSIAAARQFIEETDAPSL